MNDDRIIKNPDQQAQDDDNKLDLAELKNIAGGKGEKNESKGKEGDIVRPEI